MVNMTSTHSSPPSSPPFGKDHQPSNPAPPPLPILDIPLPETELKKAMQAYRKALNGPLGRPMKRVYWDPEDWSDGYDTSFEPPLLLSPETVSHILQEHRESQVHYRLLVHREVLRKTLWTRWRLHRFLSHYHLHLLPEPGCLYPYDPKGTINGVPRPPGWTVYYFPDGIMFEPTGDSRRPYLLPRCLRSPRWCAYCGLTSASRQWTRVHALRPRACYPLPGPTTYPDDWKASGLICHGVIRMRLRAMVLYYGPFQAFFLHYGASSYHRLQDLWGEIY